MKFTVDKHEKYVLIKLNENKLNSLISPQLKSELILSNTEGQRNIILDLSNVKYSDSSGLSSLLVGHRICKNSDGIFILTGINENISRLIAISQLENILNIVGSVDEGIDLIFMEEIEKELKRN
ncbi:MAG: anti-anti-sigma factor [Sphingobacteriales bacterium 17-39-43]|jgi:anti-sigma B factor antagonist|uniref:STAS domain-containing protein n=1 Tax=Daejeonella sp. TaxID=2805397 RepID=UPI000BD01961|nr:STAS domain-containing protein [Daejeonella sp.]MCF8452818.1 STAS domain-containing protein [Pedobacter sp.]OYZ32926.1 MAG: anti-anti-sigma factor [Sphingobacteriales bacterium 16-39-50]OZA26336.1 MAG: anti-anti-sigma factor [Sphingobacteriales bacterium 17-39-43]MDO8991620.1 STAS domain-containing protein [Daejeonella sp.]MDP2413613.1 STAS domain-containing protein [Daejeonella sp.]